MGEPQGRGQPQIVGIVALKAGDVVGRSSTLKRAPLKAGADAKLTEVDRESIYVRASRSGFRDTVLTSRRCVSIRLDVDQLAPALDAAGQLGISAAINRCAIRAGAILYRRHRGSRHLWFFEGRGR